MLLGLQLLSLLSLPSVTHPVDSSTLMSSPASHISLPEGVQAPNNADIQIRLQPHLRHYLDKMTEEIS